MSGGGEGRRVLSISLERVINEGKIKKKKNERGDKPSTILAFCRGVLCSSIPESDCTSIPVFAAFRNETASLVTA